MREGEAVGFASPFALLVACGGSVCSVAAIQFGRFYVSATMEDLIPVVGLATVLSGGLAVGAVVLFFWLVRGLGYCVVDDAESRWRMDNERLQQAELERNDAMLAATEAQVVSAEGEAYWDRYDVLVERARFGDTQAQAELREEGIDWGLEEPESDIDRYIDVRIEEARFGNVESQAEMEAIGVNWSLPERSAEDVEMDRLASIDAEIEGDESMERHR